MVRLNQVCVSFKDNSQRTARAFGGVNETGTVEDHDMLLHCLHLLRFQKSIFVEIFHCEQRPKEEGYVSSGIFNEYSVLLRKFG